MTLLLVRTSFQRVGWYPNQMPRVNDRRAIAVQATRRVIVETAARLFIDRGYHAATLGEIAREAGVAIQTIYNSIGSRRDVLSRCRLRGIGEHAPTRPDVCATQRRAGTDARTSLDQLVILARVKATQHPSTRSYARPRPSTTAGGTRAGRAASGAQLRSGERYSPNAGAADGLSWMTPRRYLATTSRSRDRVSKGNGQPTNGQPGSARPSKRACWPHDGPDALSMPG